MDLPVCDEQPYCMAIIGRRGSGKGVACLELLKYFYKGHFDLIVWISPTFQLQQMTLDIPDHTGVIVFPEWRPEIISALYAYMSSRNEGDRQGRPKEQCLLVLDDVGLLAKKGRLSEQLDNIAFTSRHYGISTIEMAQRISLLTTSMRSQLDCLLLFKEQNPQEKVNLFRSFGFCDRKTFFETLDKHTEEKYSYVGIKNDGGRLYFFDLNGQIQPRTFRTFDRRAGSGSCGLERIRNSDRHQESIRHLQSTT